jgi:hypothetical protein
MAARSLTERLQTFDRRWIFLAMGLAIVLPLLFPLGLPSKPSPPVKATYYTIDELPDGATVFLSADFEPASVPELEPFFRGVVAHLKRKNAKIVVTTLWYQAPPLVERWMKETLETPMFEGDRAYKRNVDYVWLGFKEGKEVTISNLGQDVWHTFGGRAADGTALSSIPMMSGRRRLADFDLMVLVSAGFAGAKEYVQQVQSRYKLRMVAACTAVSTTDLSPYYSSGQLLGLAGGMSNTAAYEKMVIANLPGEVTAAGGLGRGEKALDVLNIGQLVVILAIVFGNVIYFIGRRKGGSR